MLTSPRPSEKTVPALFLQLSRLQVGGYQEEEGEEQTPLDYAAPPRYEHTLLANYHTTAEAVVGAAVGRTIHSHGEAGAIGLLFLSCTVSQGR